MPDISKKQFDKKVKLLFLTQDKKLVITGCLVLFFYFGSAQNPLVKQWDYRFGGNSTDNLYAFQQTADHGYILGGSSSSAFISGDKTQTGWDTIYPWVTDYWIVKTDSLGNKQWDKRFGGIDEDILTCLQQTSDGGYILGGYSRSGIGGDKTEANRDNICSPRCYYDYWIVKTDSLGNKLWDKRFGGVLDDVLFTLDQTSDGGYILGGYSRNSISGDKTQDIWDLIGADFWVVKINSLGIKQWDKDFGGTGYDFLQSIQQTADGGYILAGNSNSGISGDKTQATLGDYDYWIVKINSLGTKIWDKDYGGTAFDYLNSIQQTTDGGYILGGISYSGISGDKTQPLWGGTGDIDYWIVKTSSFGTKLWDKDFGGTDDEEDFGNVFQTSDGGYLISGTSYSPISGDKTEDNICEEQTWVVKTDLSGTKQWDKTLRTNAFFNDAKGYAIQTNDGCYAMTNYTEGGIGGDKTQSSRGQFDYWIIKFCDNTLCPLPPAAITPGGSATFCTGGTVVLNANTGTGWLYQWKSDFVNIPGATNSNYTVSLSGMYSCVMTNSCGSSTSNSIVVTAQTLTDTITRPTPNICFGSSVTLSCNAQNGNSYQWKLNGNNISGATSSTYAATAGGNYNCTVTNLCGTLTSNTLVMTVKPVPTAVISGTQSICSGSSAMLTIIFTGNANWHGYYYNGSSNTGYNTNLNTYFINVTPTVNTTYTLSNSFSDAYCSGTVSGSAVVTVNTNPSAVITPNGPTTFCSGSSVVLNAPVAANRTYQWKKGANLISGATSSSYTATLGGNYKVIVTNTVTGCSKTTASPTVVTVNALPTATITPQGPTTFCAGGSVVLAANTGAGLTYKWKKGSNFISGATLSNYTATTGGNYKVQVTNSNGCSKTSGNVAVSVPCKEGETITSENDFDFSVYPNPNSGEFTIKFSNKPVAPVEIEMTDALGKVVKRFEANDETVVIKESNLAKGIYCLTVRNKDEVVVKKINIVN